MIRVAVAVVGVGALLWIISSGLYVTSRVSPITQSTSYAQTAGAAGGSSWLMGIVNSIGHVFGGRADTDDSVSSEIEMPAAKAETSASFPSCVITADPASIAYNGSVTLTWTSHGAGRALLQGQGSVPTQGSLTLDNVTSTQAFALLVGTGAASSVCYTVVDVQPRIMRGSGQASPSRTP